MSSSSTDNMLIEEALQLFSKEFHAALPLRYFSEFHEDEDKLKKEIVQLKRNVWENVLVELRNRDEEHAISTMTKISSRLNKEVIGPWRKKNADHKVQSMSYLQKRVEEICNDFDKALEAQVILNPEIEVDSLKNYINSRKSVATEFYEKIWKPGNNRMHEERRMKLESHLNSKGEEVMEMHKANLEKKRIIDVLKEVRTILLEKSRQIKSYVGSRRRNRVTKDRLKVMVGEMMDYLLNGKGSALKESHVEIHFKLVETLEAEMKFLTEDSTNNAASATQQDFTQWAERLDEKLRSNSYDNNEGTHSDGRQGNNVRVHDTSERPGWVTMQQILKEDPLDLWGQEESEPEGVDPRNESLPHSSPSENGAVPPENQCNGNIVNTNEDDGDGKAMAPTKRQRQGQSCGSPSSTNNRDRDDDDNDDPATTDVTAVKKRKTGMEASDKMASGVGQVSPRRSLRKKKSGSLNSSQATPSRRSSRRPNKVPEEQDFTFTPRNEPSTSTDIKDKQRVVKRKSDRTCVPSSKRHVPFSRKLWSSNIDPKTCPAKIRVLRGDPPMYQCDVCKKNMRKADRWMLKYHGKYCEKKNRPFVCNICTLGVYSKSALEIHIRTHTKEKPFKCGKCTARFSRKIELEKHSRCHIHGRSDSFPCGMCNLSFVSPLSLHEHHNLKHHDKLHLACSHCSKRFNRGGSLKWHLLTHSNEKPFQCPICKNAYTKIRSLVLHIQNIHHKQKTVADQLARDAAIDYLIKETKDQSWRNISYTRISSAVLSHVFKKANLNVPKTNDVSYKDKLPFACSYCGMRVISVGQLKSHVVTHSNERPYKCPSCKKSFIYKGNLVTHLMNIHHEQKKVADKLAEAAAIEYLRKETTNTKSSKDIPYSNITSAVMNHVIKKGNLKLAETN